MCETLRCFWLCAINKDKKPPTPLLAVLQGPASSYFGSIVRSLSVSSPATHPSSPQLRHLQPQTDIGKQPSCESCLSRTEPLRCFFERHAGLLNSEYLGYFGCENTAGVWGLKVIHLPQCEPSCNTASCRRRACLLRFSNPF